MPILKKRINLSVTDNLHRVLVMLAARDSMPTATKARNLLLKALELEEDIALEEIVSQRDNKSARYISHRSIWK